MGSGLTMVDPQCALPKGCGWQPLSNWHCLHDAPLSHNVGSRRVHKSNIFLRYFMIRSAIVCQQQFIIGIKMPSEHPHTFTSRVLCKKR